MSRNETIAVIGLGYVGLPVAIAFAKRYPGTIGFDIDHARINELRCGLDRSGECDGDVLTATSIRFTSDAHDLEAATFFVVAVPTPVDASHRPDLTTLKRACLTVGRALRPGAVVVFESTVYPGVTEEICGPILARESGLTQGVDFKLGFSPERINPGDREHTLERIVKVVSGEDAETLDRVAAAYAAIVDAGVHRAPSIRAAEAAKVIENTQRDLNIALMNELALIFDRLGIRTKDVLEAAGTKWNFLRFSPGLVGGHCIGVDPYYLTAKAEEVGYHPEVILAGRRINDGMGRFIAHRVVQLLNDIDRPLKRARIAILGLTFKENVRDLRNSRVPEIAAELRQFGVDPWVHDPLVGADEACIEYGIELRAWDELEDMDAVVLAVPHRTFLDKPLNELLRCLRSGGILVDVKSVIDPAALPPGTGYWSL